MADWHSLYGLNRDQQDEFVHTADLFDPLAVTEAPGTKRFSPRDYNQATPDYASVPCRYKPTTDYEMVSPLGQTTQSNINTQDHFHFHALQPVSTNWRVRFRGKFWTVQGEPLESERIGRNDTDTKVAIAKLGP